MKRQAARMHVVEFALLAVAVGCSGPIAAPPASVGLATTGATLAPSPIPTNLPTPSPTQTAVPPTELEIVRFAVAEGDFGGAVVELRNPNAEWGLVRSGFDLTALDKDGGVLSVTGSEGLPGAPCCTIYNLPPGESWALSPLMSDTRGVAAFEIRTKGPWVAWDDAMPAEVSVTGPKLRVSAEAGFVDASVTGRISIVEGGPYNVAVLALAEGSDGFGWITGYVDCVSGGRDYPFEIQYLSGPFPVKKPTLVEVFARTTTVLGVGSDTPPGC